MARTVDYVAGAFAGGRVRTLGLLSGAFFLVFLGMGAFQQYVSPYLLQTHHLGASTSNAVLATVYLVAFVGLTFSTYSIGLFGEYTALVLGTLCYGLFGVVALITGNVVVLVLAAALWGWGSSVLWPAGTALALDLAGAGTYGRFSGMLYSGVYTGQALGVLLLGLLEASWGPRSMVVCAVVLTLLGTGAALCLPRQRHRRSVPRLLNPLGVLAAPETRTASLILMLSSSGFGLLLGVFGQIVAAIYGLAAVGWLTGAFYVARIPAGSGGGWLIDRLSRRPVLCGVFLTSAIALLLAALLHHPVLFALCAAALGVQAAVVPVGLMTWVGDRAAAADRPSTFAAVQLWANMGTGLAILGGHSLLALLGGWQGSFVFFAALFLACTALASRLV